MLAACKEAGGGRKGTIGSRLRSSSYGGARRSIAKAAGTDAVTVINTTIAARTPAVTGPSSIRKQTGHAQAVALADAHKIVARRERIMRGRTAKK
jgi:hypothetical protein